MDQDPLAQDHDPHAKDLSIPKSERTLAMIMHLSAISGYLFLPFGNVIIPLIIWLMKKDESAFIDHQGREIINFQLSMLFYFAISAVLIVVLIGFVLIGILYVYAILVTIVAAVRVSDGVRFRYPATIRLI